jgi:hypothetical protein
MYYVYGLFKKDEPNIVIYVGSTGDYKKRRKKWEKDPTIGWRVLEEARTRELAYAKEAQWIFYLKPKLNINCKEMPRFPKKIAAKPRAKPSRELLPKSLWIWDKPFNEKDLER